MYSSNFFFIITTLLTHSIDVEQYNLMFYTVKSDYSDTNFTLAEK